MPKLNFLKNIFSKNLAPPDLLWTAPHMSGRVS